MVETIANLAGGLIGKGIEKGLDIYGNHLENQDNIEKSFWCCNP